MNTNQDTLTKAHSALAIMLLNDRPRITVEPAVHELHREQIEVCQFLAKDEDAQVCLISLRDQHDITMHAEFSIAEKAIERANTINAALFNTAALIVLTR